MDDSEPPALAFTQSDREEDAALESDMVFVKDGLSRDHGLHSRDHSPSPNHKCIFNVSHHSIITQYYVWFT